MTILDKIVKDKRKEVALRKSLFQLNNWSNLFYLKEKLFLCQIN